MASLVGWVVAAAVSVAPRVDVVWSGPEACPSDRFVEGLARHLAASEAEPVAVAAEVEQEQGAWRLVATLSAHGETYASRSFSGRSCEAVVDAAALATAIAIDPLHVADEPAPAVALPEPVPEAVEAVPAVVLPPVRTPTPTVARDAVAAPRRRARITRGFFAVAGSIDGGALPGVGAGVVASTGVIHRKLRFELVAGWRAPVRAYSGADPEAGARIDLLQLGARLCRTIAPARAIELPLCAGLDSGIVRGRGFGTPSNQTARLWWLAAIASAGVSWRMTERWALFAKSELGVPLRLHEFAIVGLDTVDRVAPVFGRGLGGVEVRFP